MKKYSKERHTIVRVLEGRVTQVKLKFNRFLLYIRID